MAKIVPGKSNNYKQVSGNNKLTIAYSASMRKKVALAAFFIDYYAYTLLTVRDV